MSKMDEHKDEKTPQNADRTLFTNDKLGEPPNPTASQLWAFLTTINREHNLSLTTYHDLHEWSTTNISAFWAAVYAFTHITSSVPYTSVLDETQPMFPRPAFFPDARLNFAQNLLFPTTTPPLDPDSPAIIAATETTRSTITWTELRQRVKQVQAALRRYGLKQNDRVAGFVANHVDAVVFMLAATSLGAIWTGLSPDSGVSMALDRLKQIEPRVLVVDCRQEYGGKVHGVLGKVREIVAGLGSLRGVVVLSDGVDGSAEAQREDLSGLKPEKGAVWSMYEFLGSSAENGDEELTFEQLPADHPVYILYSSGTTGAPKCIVHGAIGTLIQHKKEHVLQCDIRPGDRLLYFTTTTWMMWHWLVSGLASGTTIVLYDSSPVRYRDPSSSEQESKQDDLAMPRLLSELEITHFGTSAKYLSVLEQKALHPLKPPHNIALPHLRAIYNTASPLAPSTFRYVYAAFPPWINLASITGGTDIISLFGAPSPLSPVYAGEVQVSGLGMAVRAFDSESPSNAPIDITDTGRAGDLVCTRPFPCQPVAFWPFADQTADSSASAAAHERYRSSYFDRFNDSVARDKPIWHHGDYIAFNPSTGGMLMLGRSDGVLNPAGIRFGSSEIYNVLLRHFAGVVADGLCVGRRREGEADETIVLFVLMEEGCAERFGAELIGAIKKTIRNDLSARHVPALVDMCLALPLTVNGKKVEGAVKKILSGDKVPTSASVANAESLDFFREWTASHP